ncbi:hypothetical protein [Falsiroseomonas sp.]|uniref:hypothetical protein n=1 Tax=Falsiroseomonas sp. TaxID=2870721 RepID=UPI003F70BE07
MLIYNKNIPGKRFAWQVPPRATARAGIRPMAMAPQDHHQREAAESPMMRDRLHEFRPAHPPWRATP